MVRAFFGQAHASIAGLNVPLPRSDAQAKETMTRGEQDQPQLLVVLLPGPFGGFAPSDTEERRCTPADPLLVQHQLKQDKAGIPVFEQ